MHTTPSPAPGAASDVSRPSDLAAGEAEVAGLFDQIGTAPPEDLEGRVLEAFHPAPASRFRVPRGRFLPLALLLVGLAAGAVAWVSLAAKDAKVDARARRYGVPAEPAIVLDDPHVPLFRGLEDLRSLDVGRPDEDELAASCGEVGGR